MQIATNRKLIILVLIVMGGIFGFYSLLYTFDINYKNLKLVGIYLTIYIFFGVLTFKTNKE